MKTIPNALVFWTIYDHPIDFPNHFVVRRSQLVGGVLTHDYVGQLADSLAEARQCVPAGLHNLGRMPNDDPKIVEVWI